MGDCGSKAGDKKSTLAKDAPAGSQVGGKAHSLGSEWRPCLHLEQLLWSCTVDRLGHSRAALGGGVGSGVLAVTFWTLSSRKLP